MNELIIIDHQTIQNKIYTIRGLQVMLDLELSISVNEDTIWLTQKQIAELFEVTIPNINMHIKAIYKEEELF